MDNKDIEIFELKVKLERADEMARAIDILVERRVLGARSIVADARLRYGMPYIYEFSEDE